MWRQRKRVLFVERNLRNEKLGIMYLAGSLRARGHDAHLVQADREDLDARIRQDRPDFVAFSITTGEHVHALRYAHHIKQRFGIPSVFGGPHCTFFPEIALRPEVDFAVQGQGERAILDIVEGRVGPGFHKAAMAEHLDDIPDPDRDIFYQFAEFRDNPMKNVITSRACPYRCAYCFNHSQLALTKLDGEARRWFDRRSIENVTREILAMGERYPLGKILFIDDSFIQSKTWLGAFLDGYTERVKLPWLCSLRVNCLDERLAERMFASGLEMVNYAVESADPDVQQRLLNRGHVSNGDVIRAISLFDQYGVRARMQNMIGLPLTNPLEDALNTLQFNMRHRVTDAWCSIFQPYPRTALGQYCVDHGFITDDQLSHCSESFFDESRLNIQHKQELYALQKLWYFIIEGDLPLDLVQILIRGEFTSAVADELQRLRFRCSRRKLYGLEDQDPQMSTNLQSRERMRPSSGETDDPRGGAADVVCRALAAHALPPAFTDILTRVVFPQQQIDQLRRFADGLCVCEPPIYTIDERTGELADPDVSIYTRGTHDPDASDIRTMPEAHFMQGMKEVRDKLAAGVSDMDGTLDEKDAESTRVALQIETQCDEDDEVHPVIAGDSDERHLNQFLA